MNRRHFLSTAASTLAVSAASGELPVQRSGVPIDQEPLQYEFSALEPHIDAATMEMHYTKCHAGYVAQLHEALDSVNLEAATVTSLLRTMDHLTPQGKKAILQLGEQRDEVPEDVKLALLHNGGGHMNHTLFWRYMAPAGSGPQKPQGGLAEALQAKFGGVGEFKKAFTAAAMKHFGSGWVWLSYRKDAGLFISTTVDENNPLMHGVVPASEYGRPILCLDLWEHAYYGKYRNHRADYVAAWWNVVNWTRVEQSYTVVTTTNA
jgi:superoxide dismutase, Fe-Mn family